MKLRIGSCNDKYWIEGKTFLRWRRLPSYKNWFSSPGLRFEVKFTEYYNNFDEAMEEAKKYQVLYDDYAVYVMV